MISWDNPEHKAEDLERFRAKCSQLERENIDLRCIVGEQRGQLQHVTKERNAAREELQALKLEFRQTHAALSMSLDQFNDASARAYRYHQTIDLLVGRLARYRKAVKTRLTTIADRVGIATATLHARIEELERKLNEELTSRAGGP